MKSRIDSPWSWKMNRIPRIGLGLTLALLLGWNSTVLQGLAWCSMVVTYGQQAPLKTAVAWTFDGRHPCQLCRLAQKTASSEQQPKSIPTASKVEGVVPMLSEVAVPRVPVPLPAFAHALVPPSRTLRPVVPPPRLG